MITLKVDYYIKQLLINFKLIYIEDLHEWLFHMESMLQAYDQFYKFHMKQCKTLFIILMILNQILSQSGLKAIQQKMHSCQLVTCSRKKAK